MKTGTNQPPAAQTETHGDPSFNRRRFLGGGGALIALPFLESLLPRTARAQAASTPKRLIYYYVPNGINMATFKPTASGAYGGRL